LVFGIPNSELFGIIPALIFESILFLSPEIMPPKRTRKYKYRALKYVECHCRIKCQIPTLVTVKTAKKHAKNAQKEQNSTNGT
jgi:hypothetical protein